jgi:hypothetical protein
LGGGPAVKLPVATQNSDGRRDLSLIRASGSTARVLNLALVYERHGETSEFRQKPLFRSQKLNRALFVKHALRDHERALFDTPEPHTTKIILPYSPTELGLGGSSVMVGERRFEQALRHAIGAAVNDDDVLADFELISILHDLPSFDPFLLKEQLRRTAHEPAACFFEVSVADVAAMFNFVQREIEPLVRVAFGAAGRKSEKLAMRLSQKLMTDDDAHLLAPLRETMRLGVGEFAEGVFAWKGFLYYKWMLRDFAAVHAAFAKRFMGCAVAADDVSVRQEINRLKQSVLRRIGAVTARANELIAAYDRAFSSLVAGSPNSFREFLLEAPEKFLLVGEGVGAIKHIYSLWSFRFPEHAPLRLEQAEALEMLQEFERMLSGLDVVNAKGPERAL